MRLSEKIAIARDLVKSIYSAAAGIAGGYIGRVEASEKIRRMNICKTCPHFDEQLVKCKICKCKGRGLDLKASVNVWKCPKKKWHAGNIDAPYGYCLKCSAINTTREEQPEKNRVKYTCTNNHTTYEKLKNDS